jgi:hypothetical protein
LLTACSSALLTCVATAGAATFTVNDTRDLGLEHSNLTQCRSSEGTCTLRAAVQAADNVGGPSTITLPAEEYELALESTAPDQPANGDLDIRGSATAITIEGAGAGVTVINADHIDRAFAVQSGESLDISGVTVENGEQTGSGSQENSTESGYGGAFLNNGSLTISRSVLRNDSAIYGGVVSGEGLTSVAGSTLEGSTSEDEGGAIAAYGGSVALVGDTITNSQSDGPGGVLFAGSRVGTVAVEDATITGSVAHNQAEGFALGNGGAMQLENPGGSTISQSTLDGNSAENVGGAIDAYGSAGPVTVEDSRFSDDAAAVGGAIDTYESASPLTISGSTFHGDSATGTGGAGGALYIYSYPATTITSSSFSGDEAGGQGGAIWEQGGRVDASDSTFTADTAGEAGGAISEAGGHGVGLTNDTLDGNHAALAGGALYLPREGADTLLNDTLTRNSAPKGGGIYEPEHATSIENTIIAANTGGSWPEGGGDCFGAKATATAATADAGGNLDGDRTCFSSSVAGDHPGVSPLLGTLAVNGGLTETDALLAGSPAIGAGVNAPLACPASDQRGVSRSGRCDSGAYQYVPPAPASPAGESAAAHTAATQCRSARVERIHWKAPRGIRLTRIRVTLDGHAYRTLSGSARSVTVSLVGLARGAVTVHITGVARSGARYGTNRVFHPCLPARPGARRISDYLRRL